LRLTIPDGKDSPPKNCTIIYPDDCGDKPGDGCVISAIANQTALFVKTSTPDVVRKEALMYLLHFIGDLHQPLHTEHAFRGGNDINVCFGDRCSRVNLHSVWDSYIPHKIVGISDSPTKLEEKDAAKRWTDELFVAAQKSGNANVMNECHNLSEPDRCTLQWARESNGLVCEYVLKTGETLAEAIKWLEEHDLSEEYYERARPVVEKAVSKAGLRLAGWLEAIVKATTDYKRLEL
jgi:hypothetical protein